jgi:hypothetical protein
VVKRSQAAQDHPSIPSSERRGRPPPRHRSVRFVIHGVTGVCSGVSGKLQKCAGAYPGGIQAVVKVYHRVVLRSISVQPEAHFRHFWLTISDNWSGIGTTKYCYSVMFVQREEACATHSGMPALHTTIKNPDSEYRTGVQNSCKTAAYLVRLNSMRLFLALPSFVLLSAIGLSGP